MGAHRERVLPVISESAAWRGLNHLAGNRRNEDRSKIGRPDSTPGGRRFWIRQQPTPNHYLLKYRRLGLSPALRFLLAEKIEHWR